MGEIWLQIVENWTDMLVVAVCGLGVGFFNHYFKLIKKEIADLKKEFRNSIIAETDEKLEAHHEKLEKVAGEVRQLRGGLLSVQGNLFRDECRRSLEEDHEITLAEYEQLEEDHSAYNGLGGNHTGDSLFDLATAKFRHGLKNE